ncbi:MAG: hypothetical protein GX442_22710 [Candidatus Riflebacteria bacterium]|nr:hypothetical protein [Candidatus Riflebacteria bacterium]
MPEPRLLEDTEKTREICARHRVPFTLLERLLDLEARFGRSYQKRRGLHEEIRRLLEEAMAKEVTR